MGGTWAGSTEHPNMATRLAAAVARRLTPSRALGLTLPAPAPSRSVSASAPLLFRNQASGKGHDFLGAKGTNQNRKLQEAPRIPQTRGGQGGNKQQQRGGPRGGGRAGNGRGRDNKLSVPINESIEAKDVMLISDEGKSLGVVPLGEGIERARERGLVLAQVGKGQPVVCRMVSLEELRKKEEEKREASAKLNVTSEKTQKCKAKITQHDLNIKIAKTMKALGKGSSVLFHVVEGSRHEAEEILRQVVETCKGVGEPVRFAQYLQENKCHLQPLSKGQGIKKS